MEKGTLYCVSTGPGDPELMTLKAVRVITECAFCALSVDTAGRDGEAFKRGDWKALREQNVAFQIASGAVRALLDGEKKFLYLPVPMVRDRRLLKESREGAALEIGRVLDAGENVAWLVLGDATIYASPMYVLPILRSKGYPVQIVSGVPSFCAAAAKLSRPLCEGSGQLHILSAPGTGETAFAYPGTKVFMKAGRHLEELKEAALAQGVRIQGVSRCGMAGERIFSCAGEISESDSYYTLLIVDNEKYV